MRVCTHASVEGVQLRRADQARTRLERPRRKTVRPVGAGGLARPPAPRTRRGGICCRPAAREERFPDPVWVPALRHLSNIKGGGPGGSAGATVVAGGESAGLGEHQGQGRQQADARGAARAQLPDAAGGSGHAHAERGDAAGCPAAPVSDGRQADAAAGEGIRLARGRSEQICCQ